MDTDEKITRLQEAMKKNRVNAYIIPSSDPHMSEYVADYWKSRQYFSGFTGSAGTLVVTDYKSGLWTDGRYYIQAENQLKGSRIKLFKMGQKGVPGYIDYLISQLCRGQKVAVDGRLFSAAVIKAMRKRLKEAGIELDIHLDLVSGLWTDRPMQPLTQVYIHENQYAGIECSQKLEQVRREMEKEDADGYVMAELASIAWLFNIRASDIAYNPMAAAYAFITRKNAYLCINTTRMPEPVRNYLKAQKVTVMEYEAIEELLKKPEQPMKVLCSDKYVNAYIYQLLEENPDITVCHKEDPVIGLKAIKNPVEIENIVEAHIKDGCAMTRFMMALEDKMAHHEEVTEYSVVQMLKEARAQQENNKGESFASIVAYKENAAMMHYAPTREHHKKLENEGLLLIDSGGQYLEGTTDITRTFALGPVTEEEKKHYTLVLKSHIALAKAVFMEGCTGGNLDILAREPLWQEGLDYKCGTGHGVGFFLGVHEGPQSIRTNSSVPVKKGMLITDEPGVYIEGSHGIRTENILLVIGYANTEQGVFYQFRTITYFPIDTTPVLTELLTDEEINWLNQYHQTVYEKLSPRLTEKEKEWLLKKTKPIG